MLPSKPASSTQPGQPSIGIKAIPKALSRTGIDLADVALFEINEAFASMCVATVEALGIDPDKVNPNGSGCSLGHPIAMTGTRMLTTLVYELRRRGGGIGVAAMCAGAVWDPPPSSRSERHGLGVGTITIARRAREGLTVPST